MASGAGRRIRNRDRAWYAFGTGTHETTKMMLSMMLRHLAPVPSTTVLTLAQAWHFIHRCGAVWTRSLRR